MPPSPELTRGPDRPDPAGPIRGPEDPVLVLGATGFVGRPLVSALRARGRRVRALVRDAARARDRLPAEVELVVGDVVDGTGLDEALRGVRLAYYLVHSMGGPSGKRGFAERDRRAATELVRAADRSGLERVVYLGGLGGALAGVSTHLESRREVATILRGGRAAVTELRAGVVLGAGGASFEMMAQLVERLPVMLTPRWIETPCQPIALEDLVEYLVACGELNETAGRTFDVGGPEVLAYVDALRRVGRAVGRAPLVVALPLLTPSLSSHWVGFITEVPATMARPIVEGMATNAVCTEAELVRLVPRPLLPFDVAVRRALDDPGRAASRRRLLRLPRALQGRFLRLYKDPNRGRRGAVPPSRAEGAT